MLYRRVVSNCPTFLQQSFIILLPLLSPFPCTPYEYGVREVMAIHYFMQEKCLQPPLYPPCSMVQACPVRWTKQACAINTVSLYSLETATFLAKVFRILIQVLSDLAASSTKSFTKFCRYIQHPSLSEEKDKPVEPERLKLKIERYRSLE